MPDKQPTPEEFNIEENKVTHVPTGASMSAYPGRAEPRVINPGNLGNELSNGDDYDEDEVWESMKQLLRNRLKK